MRLPMPIQSALAEHCGDRFVPVGTFKDMAGSLDYPCSTGLDPKVIDLATIDQAATTLRNSEAIIPPLRLRLADVKTIVRTLVTSNQNYIASLKSVLEQRP